MSGFFLVLFSCARKKKLHERGENNKPQEHIVASDRLVCSEDRVHARVVYIKPRRARFCGVVGAL